MIRKKKNRRYPNNEQEKELLQFLSGKMNKEQQLSFEERMEHDDFLNDASEGLNALDKDKIPQIIADLNLHLKKQIKTKKNRFKLFNHSKLLIWIAVIVVLLFVFIAWWYLALIVK